MEKATRQPARPGTAMPDRLLAGRYEILRHLASGGMAELYLARTTGVGGFERHVVVKRIRSEYAREKRFVTMFLDEARLAAQLHHQNIAQVFDIGEEDGTYYFTMEYVHGVDIRAVLKRNAMLGQQLPLEHALAIVCGAAAGLHHAHDRCGPDRRPLELVHRDVSPSNILVTYDGAVKVVDFGIAKATSRITQTKTGNLKGKIAYMSPEQCLGKPLDRRSDVFALGIVLYELTTVSRLFRAENDYLTMNRIVAGEVPPPGSRRPGYPPALEAIVMRCLARDHEARWPTAEALQEALEQFAVEHRIALTTGGLGRYLRELLGVRPEPWLEAEEETAADPRWRAEDEDDGEDLESQTSTRSDVAPAPSAMAQTAVARRPAVETAPSVVPAVPPRRWPWFAVGGAVLGSGVAAALWLGGGGEGPLATPPVEEPAAVIVHDAAPASAEPRVEPIPPTAPAPTATATPVKKRRARGTPPIDAGAAEPAAPRLDRSELLRPSRKKDGGP